MVGENKPQEAIVQSCYRKGLQLLIYKGITFALQNTGNPKIIDVYLKGTLKKKIHDFQFFFDL